MDNKKRHQNFREEEGKAGPKHNLQRRKFLPILGGGLLLPLLPLKAASTAPTLEEEQAEEEYRTLLKPDGKAVRVKVSQLKKSKVVRKKLSNQELLGWLKPKKDR